MLNGECGADNFSDTIIAMNNFLEITSNTMCKYRKDLKAIVIAIVKDALEHPTETK